MMERMGYDFIKESGFNFSKEKQALFRSFVPKGKDLDYYHKIRRGLGYVSLPALSDPESKKEVNHDSSSPHRCGTQISASAISSKVSQ